MEGESPALPSESEGGNVDFDTQLATACEQYFSQKIEFRLATKVSQTADTEKAQNGHITKQAWTDGIPEPKVMLFDPAKLQLTWKQPRSIGAALVNVGNTCFFNSVIQCLTYTPPIVSYLHTGDHHEKCRIQGFCALCEFRQHCLKVQSANSSVVQPKLVYHLKAIGKNFRLGRQEDAHEFLRYFVDAMQQSCLKMHVSPEKLDAFSKATTVIHQIFGGFHRSRVVCLECKKVSDTYDPLLDISLDINFSSTLTKALQHSTKADLLSGNNRYACPHCKKMTNAHKMFTVHRPPNVLTIHLKRFDFSRGLGVKLGTSIDYGEYLDIRPYTSDKSGAPLWYRLYAVVEHLGFSIHSGHYICYVRNSNGIWYCMNDAKVSQTSINNVLRREAYLLFYIRDHEHMPLANGGPQAIKPGATTAQGVKVKDDASFLRAPDKASSQGIPFKLPGLATPLMKSKLVRPMGVVSPSTTSSTSALSRGLQHTFEQSPHGTLPGGCGVPQGCGPVTSGVQVDPKGGVADHQKSCNYPAVCQKQANGGKEISAAVCDVQSKGNSSVTPNGSIASTQAVLDNQPVGGVAHLEKTSPSLGLSHCSELHVLSNSSKIAPQIAMVSPLPHVSTKPVARVLPNPKPLPLDRSEHPQLNTKADSEDISETSDDGLGVTARLNNASTQHTSEATAACSSTPYGPALPKDYSIAAAALSPPISTSRNTPPTSTSRNTPPISTSRNTPPISTSRNTPPTSTSRNTGSPSSLKKQKKKKKKSWKKRKRSHSDQEHGDKDEEGENDTKLIKSKSVSGSEHRKHTPSGTEGASGDQIQADDHCSTPVLSKNPTSTPVVTNEQNKHHSHASRLSPDSKPSGKKKHKSANVVTKKVEDMVPVVVEWDGSLGPQGKGLEAKWDGCHQSDVVEKLTAHSHSKIGAVVKSWDGGENSIDSCVGGKHSRKRPRDDWDEELDRGKIKKVKEAHEKNTRKSSRNAFQDFQNKKFVHTSYRSKSPFHPHHHHKHKHIHHHTF
ncbi:hypothetical protein EMCRGX_G028614 [Ephydatia muelleri]